MPITIKLWFRILLRWGVLDTTLCDKVCQWLVTGRWFSPDTPVSSTNQTDSHDIAEILLKVVVTTINQATLLIPPSYNVTIETISDDIDYSKNMHNVSYQWNHNISMCKEIYLQFSKCEYFYCFRGETSSRKYQRNEW